MHWFVFLCDHSKLCLLNLIPFGDQLWRAGPFNLLVSRLGGEGGGHGESPCLLLWIRATLWMSGASMLGFGGTWCEQKYFRLWADLLLWSCLIISNFEYFTEWTLYIFWKMISCSPDWTFSLNSKSPLPFLPFLCFHVSVRKKRWQFIYKGSESNAVETSPTPYHSQIIVRMHPSQEWWC